MAIDRERADIVFKYPRLRRVHNKKEAAPDLDCVAGVNKEGVGEGERGRKNGEPPPRLLLLRGLIKKKIREF